MTTPHPDFPNTCNQEYNYIAQRPKTVTPLPLNVVMPTHPPELSVKAARPLTSADEGSPQPPRHRKAHRGAPWRSKGGEHKRGPPIRN